MARQRNRRTFTSPSISCLYYLGVSITQNCPEGSPKCHSHGRFPFPAILRQPAADYIFLENTNTAMHTIPGLFISGITQMLPLQSASTPDVPTGRSTQLLGHGAGFTWALTYPSSFSTMDMSKTEKRVHRCCTRMRGRRINMKHRVEPLWW